MLTSNVTQGFVPVWPVASHVDCSWLIAIFGIVPKLEFEVATTGL